MIIKNVVFRIIQLKKYFTFEVQVLDDKNVRRRFRASNYQSTTRVKPFICTMPMRLDEGSPNLIQDGIKYSSTCRISQGEHMDRITYRLWEWLFMRIAESEEYTFRTDCTASKSCHQSLNFSYQFRSSSELTINELLILDIVLSIFTYNSSIKFNF